MNQIICPHCARTIYTWGKPKCPYCHYPLKWPKKDKPKPKMVIVVK